MQQQVSLSSMGQHLGKRESPVDSKAPSPEPEVDPTAAEEVEVETEAQDEVFAPQKASATSPRKRGAENAVVHFFRTIVSPAPPKSRWRGVAAKMGLGDQKSQSKAKKASAGDGKVMISTAEEVGALLQANAEVPLYIPVQLLKGRSSRT
ncbi:myelin basic protein-like isoform X1 [Solea senegalensis]|uniref:Myelin basic protein-like isoform X1 n=1 Tax=Solea senegalensis TaxID=28829 RepID=A0AAV6PR78_SOLSE|nr:myelin basic protein-like isoform X1 [Solea senegalensis]